MYSKDKIDHSTESAKLFMKTLANAEEVVAKYNSNLNMWTRSVVVGVDKHRHGCRSINIYDANERKVHIVTVVVEERNAYGNNIIPIYTGGLSVEEISAHLEEAVESGTYQYELALAQGR